jgi:hypothetical protein
METPRFGHPKVRAVFRKDVRPNQSEFLLATRHQASQLLGSLWPSAAAWNAPAEVSYPPKIGQ